MDERLHFLLEMGRGLLEAGAETARAEDTILRAGQRLGFAFIDTLMTPSGIWIAVAEEGRPAETALMRVERREIWLTRLVALNDLSRAMVEGRVPFPEARVRLKAILRARSPYGRGVTEIGGGLAAAAYTGILGASGVETVAAFALGLWATWLRRLLRGRFADRFLSAVLGGCSAGFFGSVGSAWFHAPLRPEILIAAGIVILVPGLQITNAIRDVLHGDLISAASLGLEAFVLALGLAFGVAFGIGLVIWGRHVV